MKTPSATLSIIKALLLLTFFTWLQSSCSKDDFNPDLANSPAWQPEIAFPLAYSEIGMSDLAHANDSSTTIIYNNDQFCTLVYNDKIFELTSQQLVQIPDQTHQNQFSLNNGEILTLNNNGQVQVSQSQDLNFSISQGIEIDSIILKNSRLFFDMTSGFPANSEIRVTIPALKKNGTVFSQIIRLNYQGNSPVTTQVIAPLDQYHMDLTKNGTTNNTLTINYVITFTGNSGNVNASNTLQCTATFEALNFKTFYGYIGQQSIANAADSVELSIFNNSIGTGTFTIVNPKINFDISNSTGIPFEARILQLTALNANQTNFTVATGIPDPMPVSTPSLNQIGQTLTSSFTLDNQNSNITSMITEKPKYLVAQSQVTTNPSGPGINFLTDSARLAMNVHVELPLYGTASDFRITDTVPFNYSDLENVENLTLRMNIENWFPLESSLQLIFTDADYLPLDTMFVPGEVVIPSGIITGNSDRVSIAGIKIQDEIFDRLRILKILSARNIIVEATASTFQQGNTNVKIYNDYKLKLKIGAIAKMTIH